MVFEEQLLPFQDHLSVAVPHAEAHETIEQIFQAHMLVVTMQVIVSPPKEAAQVNLVLGFVVALLQEGLVMVDERQLALVVGEADAKEAPSVPRIDLGIGFVVGDERFLGMFDPKAVAARGAHKHLLRRGDQVVVQHLAVRIQDSLIHHLGFQDTTFEPGLAMRALEII